MNEPKDILRRAMLARRAALPQEQVASWSLRALDRLRLDQRFRSAREALLYMPFRNELDVRPLLAELWARGARVLLPRCLPGRPGEMELACVTCLDEIRPGMHSIPEPDPDRCRVLDAFRPDLALVPGVAFDRRGFRLGFGGGYYDRILTHPGLRDTALIGMAFAFQVVDELPVEPWDRRVHAICTEESLTWPLP
jgi:5-formyltetrahydrofolate cyclo-ligase